MSSYDVGSANAFRDLLSRMDRRIAALERNTLGVGGVPDIFDRVFEMISRAVSPPAGDLPSFSPILTQGVEVAKRVVEASYVMLGTYVLGNVRLDVTGTGTAATGVTVTFPVPSVSMANTMSGKMSIFDADLSRWWSGNLVGPSNGAICLSPSGGALGASDFTTALAAGDIVTYQFGYESKGSVG